VGIQGLDQVDIKASLSRANLIPELSVASHSDQKKPPAVPARTKLAREFVSIQAGESNTSTAATCAQTKAHARSEERRDVVG
jgi:hypothetical protein